MFRSLNAARRSAEASHPTFFTTQMHAYLLNNHTTAISKPPLLSILTNYGAHSAPLSLYITSAQTGFKPLIPVIDVLSGHVISTDPRGGLSVPILGGQPRVFLPLSVHSGVSPKAEWQATFMGIDTKVRQAGPSSPASPGGTSMRLRPSLGGVISWFGSMSGMKEL